MSAQREWKPGDVALLLSNGSPITFFYKLDENDRPTDEVMFTSTTGFQHPASRLAPARKAVVIDPEDESQIERVRDYLETEFDWFGMREDNTIECLAEAIKSLLDGPRVPEPKNDGALVECDYDGKHGRAVRLGGSWTFYGDALRDGGAIYEEFTNVRVLSEGVTDAD